MQILHFCKVVIDAVYTKHVISMQYIYIYMYIKRKLVLYLT